MESPENPFEGWLRLSEGLIAGVHHALNNRLASLSAVGQVVESDLPADHPLSGALSEELDRIEASVAILRLLSGGRSSAEPVLLESVLDDAGRLFGLHHALRDLRLEVESAPSLLPLYTDPNELLRAVLMMMAVAGRRALGGDGIVRVTVSGDESGVEVVVEGRGPSDGDVEALAGIVPESASVQLVAAGGELSVSEEGDALSLRASLPTLPEVRRREAAGS